jgi:2-iminobutanoate/2-iminopropanoate deaminase
VNVEIERCAWGAFSTEFFPTYDFIPVRERLAREWREAKEKGASRAKERAADRREA